MNIQKAALIFTTISIISVSVVYGTQNLLEKRRNPVVYTKLQQNAEIEETQNNVMIDQETGESILLYSISFCENKAKTLNKKTENRLNEIFYDTVKLIDKTTHNTIFNTIKQSYEKENSNYKNYLEILNQFLLRYNESIDAVNMKYDVFSNENIENRSDSCLLLEKSTSTNRKIEAKKQSFLKEIILHCLYVVEIHIVTELYEKAQENISNLYEEKNIHRQILLDKLNEVKKIQIERRKSLEIEYAKLLNNNAANKSKKSKIPLKSTFMNKKNQLRKNDNSKKVNINRKDATRKTFLSECIKAAQQIDNEYRKSLINKRKRNAKIQTVFESFKEYDTDKNLLLDIYRSIYYELQESLSDEVEDNELLSMKISEFILFIDKMDYNLKAKYYKQLKEKLQ